MNHHQEYPEKLEDYQVELMSTSALAQESTNEEVEREIQRLTEGGNGVVGEEKRPERGERREENGERRSGRGDRDHKGPKGERKERPHMSNNEGGSGDRGERRERDRKAREERHATKQLRQQQAQHQQAKSEGKSHHENNGQPRRSGNRDRRG